jgi:DNA-binding transcriptional MerR regulator
MPDEPLLTLRELGVQLDLPESTVRYYRDAFLDFIPSVGTGRRRRYPPQAVLVLRRIAASYAAGRARAEIVGSLQQDAPGGTAVALKKAQPTTPRSMEDVTNLDLLAAILDGEREQRDALWQMAKEIVRLTEVLERQDGVLTEIADQAGVIVAGRQPLSLGTGATEAPAPPAAAPKAGARVPFAPPAPPAPSAAGPPDVAQLKAELESERALVERLREAKLHVEHRAADAEAALAEQRARRSSVIKRLLGGEDR